MKRFPVIEFLLCVALVLGGLTFVSDYMAPAGSQRTGQGDACFCGGKMNINAGGKSFTCSRCGRQEPNVVD